MPRVLAPELLRVAARRGVVGGDGREAELVAQFLLPLVHQRRHGQHEEPLHHAARQQFLEHQAGLDGLAQTHFVGQQRAAAQGPQHAQGGAQLVLQPLHAAIRQAKQVVRLVGNPPQRRPLAQANNLAGRPGRKSSPGTRAAAFRCASAPAAAAGARRRASLVGLRFELLAAALSASAIFRSSAARCSRRRRSSANRAIVSCRRASSSARFLLLAQESPFFPLHLGARQRVHLADQLAQRGELDRASPGPSPGYCPPATPKAIRRGQTAAPRRRAAWGCAAGVAPGTP